MEDDDEDGGEKDDAILLLLLTPLLLTRLLLLLWLLLLTPLLLTVLLPPDPETAPEDDDADAAELAPPDEDALSGLHSPFSSCVPAPQVTPPPPQPGAQPAHHAVIPNTVAANVFPVTSASPAVPTPVEYRGQSAPGNVAQGTTGRTIFRRH